MLNEVLKYLKNYFPCIGAESREFTIEDGNITLDFVKQNQYFLIEGSVFNDGVHKYTAVMDLEDEVFDGTITPLAIPSEVISIASEIETWQTKNGAVSPYESESFGGYSYTRMKNASGNAAGWKEAFSSRLKAWRKI